MALTKINTGGISDDAVHTNKIADSAVTEGKIATAYTDSVKTNPEFQGTEAARLPVGTTAERANEKTGDLRFNSTTGLMEYYTGSDWKAIDSSPTIASVSPSTFTTAGTTITVTGTNYSTGVNVKVIDSDGTEYTPDSVTRTSVSQLTFDITTAILNSAKDAFDIKVTNSSGLAVTSADALTIPNGTFAFTNSASSTIYDTARASGFSAGGSLTGGGSESDVTVTYSLQSGSLPTSSSLNTSTGLISSIGAEGSDTTYNFTIRATVADASEGTSDTYDRAFALTVAAPAAQAFSYTGAAQSWSIPSGVTSVLVRMWGAGGNGDYSNHSGGNGAGVVGTLNISSLSTLGIIVGRGGAATTTGGDGGAGGGFSGVFSTTTYTQGNALLIAGGGGGAGDGNNAAGGHASGTTGGDGSGDNTTHNGKGGTTSAAGASGNGGTGSTYWDNCNGYGASTMAGALIGGDGGYTCTGAGQRTWNPPTKPGVEQGGGGRGGFEPGGYVGGGGGGGGYYGGGGGSAGAWGTGGAGGGAGSSYAHPTLASSVSYSQGPSLTATGHSSGADGSGTPGNSGSGTGENGRVYLVY